jgi:hypothetical protein
MKLQFPAFLYVFAASVALAAIARSAESLNAPLRVTASADSGSGSVNLTWVENNTRMSGYQIERTSGSVTNFVAVGRTGAYTAGYSDSTALPGQAYVYHVRAFLDNTLGPASDEVSVSVPALGSGTYVYKPFVPSTHSPISAFVPSKDGRPYFRRQGTATQLIVDGAPLLMLSGQLENNTISYPRDLDKLAAVLDICQKQNQNTVEIPVQWRALEPQEGKFDFSVVDALISGCRARNLKLDILWFGSWKNSESYYAPDWVINNTKRFFRAKKRKGGDHGMVSAFCEEACQADIKAFSTLLKHVYEIDRKEHTVVLVQVENETGMFANESRDMSGPAQAAFTGPVPAKLMSYLIVRKGKLRPHLEKLWAGQGYKPSGSWTEVFGPSIWTDEVFMAWHVAQYVERVTVAGKAVYPLPMYANAWLDGDGKPGDYPTGGPVAKMRDVWRAAALSLDALSPDIYGPDFQQVCNAFNVDDNPMLVPEAYYYEPSAVAPFYAFGEVDSMLFGSYYIEGYGWGPKAPNPGHLHPVKDTFAVLREMATLILKHQGTHAMTGFFQASDDDRFTKTLGGYNLELTGTRSAYGRGQSAGGAIFLKGAVPGGGLVLAVGRDEFIIVGRSLNVSFTATGGQKPHVISAAEGHYLKSVWRQDRVRQLTEPTVKLADDKVEVIQVKLKH